MGWEVVQEGGCSVGQQVAHLVLSCRCRSWHLAYCLDTTCHPLPPHDVCCLCPCRQTCSTTMLSGWETTAVGAGGVGCRQNSLSLVELSRKRSGHWSRCVLAYRQLSQHSFPTHPCRHHLRVRASAFGQPSRTGRASICVWLASTWLGAAQHRVPQPGDTLPMTHCAVPALPLPAQVLRLHHGNRRRRDGAPAGEQLAGGLCSCPSISQIRVVTWQGGGGTAASRPT